MVCAGWPKEIGAAIIELDSMVFSVVRSLGWITKLQGYALSVHPSFPSPLATGATLEKAKEFDKLIESTWSKVSVHVWKPTLSSARAACAESHDQQEQPRSVL